jgi:hypothetical protein
MVIEESEQLSDRYRLDDVIGTGGMGTVFRARDEVLDRTVAVKLLKESLATDESAVDRFKREARIAASLTHPGIAAVYDFGQEDGRPFIVMELLEGEDLHSVVVRNGQMDPIEAATICAQIADALEHAHSAGTIHRDVKPGNIFRTGNGDIKLTDFGIARLITQTTVTTSGSVLGTYQYLSPEVVNGEKATPSADIYSLGCVLFELLTGQTPFKGETPLSVAMAHVSKPAPEVRWVNPAVPDAISAVVSKAMAKDPAERYETAADMAKALREATGSVATAPAPTLAEPVASPAAAPPTGRANETARSEVLAGPATAIDHTAPTTSRPVGLLAALAAAALVAIVLIAIIVRSLVDQTPTKIKIDDYVGRPYSTAAVAAKQAGLEPTRGEQLSVETKGEVVAQDPQPGETVGNGTVLKLIVSDGEGVPVPETLIGMSQEGAENAIRSLGLVPVPAGPDVDNEAAVVVEVRPGAQTILRRGDSVTIFLEAAEEERGSGKGKGKGKD